MRFALCRALCEDPQMPNGDPGIPFDQLDEMAPYALNYGNGEGGGDYPISPWDDDVAFDLDFDDKYGMW